MADMGRRKPSADQPLHTLPLDTSLLAPPFECVMPEVTDREAEVSQCVPVARHSEVSEMPTHDRLQPLADVRNRVMHSPPQLDLDPLQRRLHALANRLPKHHEPALPRLPADMLEAEEIEGLWLAQSNALSVGRRVASELDQPRLLRVQFQLELFHSFFQFRPEPFGIVFELESNQGVVGITHHDYIAVRTLLLLMFHMSARLRRSGGFISRLTWDAKTTGERSAANPHAPFDAAGIGNQIHGQASEALPEETGSNG